MFRDKPTTPQRICLYTSQKSSSGASLNDVQCSGKKLQIDIIERMLKFRQYGVAVSADISRMFLNIAIREQERPLQRSIINIKGMPITELQYNSLLCGATSSPFQSQRVILQLAEDGEKEYPNGAQVLRNFTFVDDILFSSPNPLHANELLHETISLLESAKFNVHKISSNSAQALTGIASSQLLEAVEQKDFTSALGLKWYKSTDDLAISLGTDPLGLVSPLLTPAKVIMQQIWAAEGLNAAEDWDKLIPHDLNLQFKEWNESLSQENLKFSRCVGVNASKNQQLYAYGDASQNAYGAVVYLRTVHENRSVDFKLIMSKGRIAPVEKNGPKGDIDKQTIPRLELCAALLNAEIVTVISQAWKLPADFSTCLFTDSKVVLAQISSDQMRNPYTENRLRKIRKLSNKRDWFYCPTDSSPADLITRGSSLNEL